MVTMIIDDDGDEEEKGEWWTESIGKGDDK